MTRWICVTFTWTELGSSLSISAKYWHGFVSLYDAPQCQSFRCYLPLQMNFTRNGHIILALKGDQYKVLFFSMCLKAKWPMISTWVSVSEATWKLMFWVKGSLWINDWSDLVHKLNFIDALKNLHLVWIILSFSTVSKLPVDVRCTCYCAISHEFFLICRDFPPNSALYASTIIHFCTFYSGTS